MESQKSGPQPGHQPSSSKKLVKSCYETTCPSTEVQVFIKIDGGIRLGWQCFLKDLVPVQMVASVRGDGGDTKLLHP